MTTYLTNRDGGKTNEEGHIRFQTKIWNGNIVSGLQAVQRSPLAMGINISVGDAKVYYSTYGYTVWTDAVEAVGIATADPSNPRIDRIVGYVDRSITPSSANSNNPGLLKFMAVTGTPAASPSAPSDVTVQAAVGASNPYFNIANVLVGTGVTTISTGNITDTRIFLTVPANSVTNSALGLAAVKSQNIDFTTFNFDSTERKIGIRSGLYVYEKTLSGTTTIVSGAANIAHGISNFGEMILSDVSVSLGNNTTFYKLPYIESASVFVDLYYTPTNVVISSTYGYGSVPYKIYLRYTKTA